MTPNITNFINTHYDVLYKGDQVNPDHYDHVTEFLLADEHTTEGFSAVNSLFINTFSTPADAVLTEGIPAMQQIQAEDTGMTAYLTNRAPIFGWDADIANKVIQASNAEILEKARAKAEVLKKQALEPTLAAEQRHAIFDKLVDAAKEARAQERAALTLDRESLYKKIEETFPARTACMISALSKSAEISKRRFLIAGEAHLHENCFDEKHGDGPSLKLPLKDFLPFIKARNVVALCPKPDKVTELGQPREELKFCVQMALAQLDGNPFI